LIRSFLTKPMTLTFVGPSAAAPGLLVPRQNVVLRVAAEAKAPPPAGLPLSTGFLGGIALAAASSASRKRSGRSWGTARSAGPAEATNVKVGDQIPAANLDKGFPPTPVPIQEFCKGKKIVLVGLPGAFTPT